VPGTAVAQAPVFALGKDAGRPPIRSQKRLNQLPYLAAKPWPGGILSIWNPMLQTRTG
jgi:hypothetical protein